MTTSGSSSVAGSSAGAFSGIELALFQSRVQAICDEMGAVLRRSAFSPNIKDRLDFSCAVFARNGELFGQAAHIPVHLGSMAYAMSGVVARIAWQPGDVAMLNDPYLGGTHLPDVTAISPAFVDGRLVAFAACRAHHANIGADRPGSMPVADRIEQEGILIPPLLALRDGALTADCRRVLDAISRRAHRRDEEYRSDERLGDFWAQLSAARLGVARLEALAKDASLDAGIAAVNDYAERLARTALTGMPRGRWEFEDALDDDGFDSGPVRIHVAVTIDDDGVTTDFSRSAPQVRGNVNCPRSVLAAGVYYVFRCLMPAETPAAAGAFRPIRLVSRRGTVVDAEPPAAVAAGNVETSQRIVDVLLGALAHPLPDLVPAASQGTMNNVAMGSRSAVGASWDYYETLGGGTGAHARGAGVSAVHSHMTNTLNTPIESLELHYPLRVVRYELRRGSGGDGRARGGDGIVREIEFCDDGEVTLLTERRRFAPWGLAGGSPGARGINLLNGRVVPGKAELSVRRGDRLRIETPGGGGYGTPLSSPTSEQRR